MTGRMNRIRTEQEVEENESTSLLLKESIKSTPLPVKSIIILGLMRCSEPIALSCIFPFINQMIEDLNIASNPADVTYYAGVIESLFALTTFCTVLAWGNLSDRIGRKPVLITGLVGVGSTVAIFGLQTTFLGLVIVRCLSGSLNGNAAVIKSVLGEISDASNRGRVFSFLPLSWSFGSVIGPILGGFLSNPAKRFSFFENSTFFKAYPYALPCFAAAAFPFLGALLGALFLDESLPSKTKRKGIDEEISGISNTIPALSNSSTSSTPLLATPSSSPEVEDPPPPFSDLLIPPVFACLICYSFLALETISLDILLIQFLYTPLSSSGLSFTSPEIGIALALSGTFTVLSQLILFPTLQMKFGTVRSYRGFMGLYPAVFGMFPILSWLGGRGEGREVIWCGLVVLLILKACGNMAYGCSMLVITTAAPSPRLLGTLNGLAQMFSSLMRSIGPFLTSLLFSYSIREEDRILGGMLVFLVMFVLSLFAWASTFLLEVEADWREVKLESEREREGEGR